MSAAQKGANQTEHEPEKCVSHIHSGSTPHNNQTTQTQDHDSTLLSTGASWHPTQLSGWSWQMSLSSPSSRLWCWGTHDHSSGSYPSLSTRNVARCPRFIGLCILGRHQSHTGKQSPTLRMALGTTHRRWSAPWEMRATWGTEGVTIQSTSNGPMKRAANFWESPRRGRWPASESVGMSIGEWQTRLQHHKLAWALPPHLPEIWTMRADHRALPGTDWPSQSGYSTEDVIQRRGSR